MMFQEMCLGCTATSVNVRSLNLGMSLQPRCCTLQVLAPSIHDGESIVDKPLQIVSLCSPASRPTATARCPKSDADSEIGKHGFT